MKVVGLQLDIVWENKPANYEKVRRLLSTAQPQPGTIVVLPEMFATGFTMNFVLAEDTGESVAALAKEYRVNLLAGIVRRSGGPRSVVAASPDGRDGFGELTTSSAHPSKAVYYNEAVLFDAQGREVARYAKMHPFKFAGENAEPGTEPVVVDCGEFKLAPAVCYDLRFPELFRAGVKRGANLFAVIANWPTPRLDHWLTLLKARAIENQAYVIGVNRCGRDPNDEYPGHSQIIGPRGEVLANAGETEGVVTAELDLTELQAYRQKFPVLKDANERVSEPEPLPISEFETQIEGLIRELFTANVHFQIATGLRKSWREYYPEFVQAHVFWRYTIHAHDTIAVLGLCRVYDNTRSADRRCLTLRRFITTINANPGVFQESEFRKRLKEDPHVESLARHFPKLDEKKLKEDMAVCDGEIAKRLIELRNNLVAHLNYEYAIGKQRDYLEKNPLPFSDIQILIDKGLEIVNRYSGIFIARTHSERLASQQDQDYRTVLESLRKLRRSDE